MSSVNLLNQIRRFLFAFVILARLTKVNEYEEFLKFYIMEVNVEDSELMKLNKDKFFLSHQIRTCGVDIK